MNNPICFALDNMRHEHEAVSWIKMLEPYVGAFKIGLELFIRTGAGYGRSLPFVLDLKLHDIPETVANAVKAGGDLGAKYMTIHIQQRKTIEKAMYAAEEFGITLLGVSVLTSMDAQDCKDLCFPESTPERRVHDLVSFAEAAGLRGFVCSPQEVRMVRNLAKTSFLLVPGIRPAGAEANDQKRTGTPSQAVQDGANLIVVGRPIRDAVLPLKAAQAILAEIRGSV